MRKYPFYIKKNNLLMSLDIGKSVKF